MVDSLIPPRIARKSGASRTRLNSVIGTRIRTLLKGTDTGLSERISNTYIHIAQSSITTIPNTTIHGETLATASLGVFR